MSFLDGTAGVLAGNREQTQSGPSAEFLGKDLFANWPTPLLSAMNLALKKMNHLDRSVV